MIHKLRPSIFAFSIALFLTQAVRADTQPSYLEPKTLTGTIYADASLKQVLYTMRRFATNSGSTIHVERDFNLPNGTLVAREQVVYEAGQLKSFRVDEMQVGSKGVVQSDGNGEKLNFNFTQGATKKTGSEKFLSEALVSDMVGPYIVAHWDTLTKGGTVKCRLIAASRVETVGFKFFKESDSTWHGTPVMMVTLAPSSLIIAQLVDPLHFVVEKNAPHRVFEYTGRTTPCIQKNGKWEDLDAVTVFNW
ncbi:MAG TPA: hypothetical protein VGI88_02280 [Verrucomicrobiae bacterium]